MTHQTIDDPDDPRVAAFRQVQERDLTGRQGRFIAEGKVVVRVRSSPTRNGMRISLGEQSRTCMVSR